MSTGGVPLNARTLAHSHQNDLQRIANPRLEVNERRLRPIYDYMEIHNYRRALTEIERLLKKQSNFTACKALKCLVLLKLDRRDEARTLADELDALASATTRSVPAGDASNVDENALTFFSQYYKDLRQFDKVVWLYESAVKREPASEEFFCALFMSYVRVKDYKNQVFTAQKLYKLTRKIPYLNWAIISVLLQIDENSLHLKQTLYVPMALKMLEKEFFDENLQQQQQTKPYGEMECLLYLHALELKEDFARAFIFLHKHLDELTRAPSPESMLPPYFSHEKQLIYNFKAGHFDIVYRLAKQFIDEDNYLWNWYEVLFDGFFSMNNGQQEELINDLHDFILNSSENTTNSRSIHLARLELGRRWQIIKNSTARIPPLAVAYLSDSFFDHLINYIDVYATKTTGLVMYDMYQILEHFSSEERTRFHTYLIDRSMSDDNIQRLINLLSCARLCGEVHRVWLIDNHHSLIQRLTDLTNQSLWTSDLFILIANIMDQIDRSHAERYALVERAYDRDPANFDIKLALYTFALYYNCLPMMKDLFERLEIKNIQYYSLGYLLTDHYLRIHTNYRIVRNFFTYLTNLLFVYTDDSWSQIMFCYKYGNFLRINEIRTFADCYLTYSHIYIQALLGTIIIELIHGGNRYGSICQILKHAHNRVLFNYEKNGSISSLFYNNDKLKVQDTRDMDVWSKIDYRRLCFDLPNENETSVRAVSYADRILADNLSQKPYQSPSYKDSFLRRYQSVDFQHRIILLQLRAIILNGLNILYIDSSLSNIETSPSAAIIQMPGERMFQSLGVVINDFDACIQSIDSGATLMFPCELQSIVEFELHKLVPVFLRILLDGLSFVKGTDEASTASVSSSSNNTSVQFGIIEQTIATAIKQLQRSYQLLVQTMENTSFQKRCQTETSHGEDSIKADFLDDFAGNRSPLEFYSIYTEFISYAFGLHLAIKSILATLLNKTHLLVDGSENGSNRPANVKKSKKKAAAAVNQQAEQQSSASSSDSENVWTKLEQVEYVFNEQWTQIAGNIHKYETWLRAEVKLNADECDRLERELDGMADQQANKTKTKPDENNNNATENGDANQSSTAAAASLEFDKLSLRPSSLQTFAMGYLESLIQIRVCLTNKQKSLHLR